MLSAYKRRPTDFKRRILSKIYSNKKDLFQEEYNWLSKVKKVMSEKIRKIWELRKAELLPMPNYKKS
jgi:hypothetical protein